MSFAACDAIIYNLRLDSNRTVSARDIYNLYDKHHRTIFIFSAEVANPFCANNYFLSSYFLWQLSSPVFPVHLSSTLRAGNSSPPATAPSLILCPLFLVYSSISSCPCPFFSLSLARHPVYHLLLLLSSTSSLPSCYPSSAFLASISSLLEIPQNDWRVCVFLPYRDILSYEVIVKRV